MELCEFTVFPHCRSPLPLFFGMSVLLSDSAFSARYVPEEPRSWILSSLASALTLPVSDGIR